jgi:hypothetical protein
MKSLNLSLATATLIAGACSLEATEVKRTLKGNMNEVYHITPKSVTNLTDAFANGIVYGRLRANTFVWDWDSEKAGEDNKAMGIGGSLIFKTAPLNGVSGTIGLYTSQNPEFFRQDKDEVGKVKAGKDTFIRNDVANGDGHYGMSVLGQAFIQYNQNKTDIKVGRQMFHSVFTKSNDTKMVPNTFDGLAITNKSLPQTTIKAAYFTGQKLRDHSSSHDVLAFDGWNENDDSAINKSLTVDLIGNDNKLIIGSATNKSIKNSKVEVSLASVPDVLTTLALEAGYKFKLASGVTVAPSFRFMNQSDDLNNSDNKGVANLKGKTDGYSKPTSLEASATMARVDIANGPIKFRLGWSKIADDADMVAPWRGFVTGGYTRAMAQYNWYANTETYMVRADYDFDKAGMVEGLTGLIRYAIQDFDDKKPGVQADSNIIHIDLVKKIASVPNLFVKTRIGLVDADDNIKDINGATKTDVSYNEYRLEFNYLF